MLTDPDPTTARSAVLGHLDRRAADLHLDPAYETWAESMGQAAAAHPFLTQRLREWSLFRAITLELPWHRDDLLTSSNWLQLKTAAGTNTAAMVVLTELGRTRRIRNTARTGLTHRAF